MCDRIICIRFYNSKKRHRFIHNNFKRRTERREKTLAECATEKKKVHSNERRAISFNKRVFFRRAYLPFAGFYSFSLSHPKKWYSSNVSGDRYKIISTCSSVRLFYATVDVLKLRLSHVRSIGFEVNKKFAQVPNFILIFSSRVFLPQQIRNHAFQLLLYRFRGRFM